jgi:hypothetical protein
LPHPNAALEPAYPIGVSGPFATRLLRLSGNKTRNSRGAHFDLVDPPVACRHTGAELLAAIPADPPPHAELEFLSPLPFKRAKEAPRTRLTLDGLLEPLQRRVKQLFGLEPAPPKTGRIDRQSHYWEYLELRHASKSQPGHTQYFNGCVGPLYFRGDLAPLLPWLMRRANM